RKLVFEEKKITLNELAACLRKNWEGMEPLRRYAAGSIEYFGNDTPESNAMVKRLVEDFIGIVLEKPEVEGVLMPPGISTFGRQISWRQDRGATADGHFMGAILSANLSPAPGTDKKGATAIIRSHCAADLQKLTCGTALDIKLLPDAVRGEKGIETLISLNRGFCALGGIFMQMDVLDQSILIEARDNPEKYQNLSVRVSGWSARFVTLREEWQEMIIERTAQGM
ncbi:MAG TPA: hypothetical protein DD727_01905, partial [Clostridiales bacterium]|nr:hypothetical protein [Clostridiales bacterium]